MNIQDQLSRYRKISPNFMTPHIKNYVMSSDGRIIEMSVGEDLDGKKIWGVTEFDTNLKTTRRGQMHRSLVSARRHFNILLGACGFDEFNIVKIK
jgi:hypothetical protein